VFHHHYYDAIAQVKCSLSRSDGDSNWFLTSWWFIPHTNHTHRSSELQITNDPIPINVAGKTRAAVPRDHPTDRNQDLVCLWAHSSCPCHTPFRTNTRTHVDPGPNNATSFAVERYFGQLNVRHAFNMTRGTSNDRSLIDTDRNYKHPRTLFGCCQLFRPVYNYPSIYGYFQDTIHSIAKVFW
jgi:hypothetical protein